VYVVKFNFVLNLQTRDKAENPLKAPTANWNSDAAQVIIKFLEEIQIISDRKALLKLLRSLSMSLDAGVGSRIYRYSSKMHSSV